MKILKSGKAAPAAKPSVFRGTCARCEAEVECEQGEIDGVFRADGKPQLHGYIACKTPGCTGRILMSQVETKEKEK